jgi:hypothetical protein
MGTRLMITVRYEGGYYSPSRNLNAPIRIYSDRRVQDDIARKYTGRKWRQRLSRKDYRYALKAAAENREMGRV